MLPTNVPAAKGVSAVWDTLTPGPLWANEELSTWIIEATDGTPPLSRKSI